MIAILIRSLVLVCAAVLAMRLMGNAGFNVLIDALRYFIGRCRLLQGMMHKMTGISIIALPVVAALLVITIDRKNHLSRKLIYLFINRHPCQQFICFIVR